MEGTKAKRNCLSMRKKQEIILAVENGEKKIAVCRKFKIPPSTLSTILINREKIKSFGGTLKNNKIRLCIYNEIDKAILAWVRSVREKNLPVSGPLIKKKALEYAKKLNITNFTASNGWLHKFKKRHCIVQKVLCGESAEVNTADVDDWKKQLSRLTDGYSPQNIFNADETGFFYKCLPDKTLIFKGEKCFGGKCSKERVTALFGTNSTGTEKLKPLIIGKSANPRCFRGVKNLGVEYFANKKAWMTSEIFKNWLQKLDRKFSSQKRKVILFVDNCTAHPKDLQCNLSSIKLLFFPPNMTCAVQPLDLGIIQNIKVNYRRRILTKIIQNLDEKKPIRSTNLLDFVREVAATWLIDVKEETIAKCFAKAGFSRELEWQDDDDIPLAEWIVKQSNDSDEVCSLWQKWKAISGSNDVVEGNDYVNVDAEIFTHEIPNDEDILSMVQQNDSDEGISDDEVATLVEKPSVEEINYSLSLLQRAVETSENMNEEAHFLLAKLQSCFQKVHVEKQQIITHYFSTK